MCKVPSISGAMQNFNRQMEEKDIQRGKGTGFVKTSDLLKALQFAQSKLHVENIYLDRLVLGPQKPD